ncbi:hypothetical protein [Paenibacillus sp. YIM B09110]|uniref:hypothetical protein n=1 Tax=Paenibacillus sp. YIM B09110 TaxID=3126102 RepID=UPI00301BF7C1
MDRISVSYPGFAYAAGAGWQVENNLDRMEPLEHHVSYRMLQDRSGGGARFLMDMGRYYHLERSTIENTTYTSYLLSRGLSELQQLERETAVMVELIKLLGGSGTPFQMDYRYTEMDEWLQRRRGELDRLDLAGADADILQAELANTLSLIGQGAGLHRYIYRQDIPDTATEVVWLERLQEQLKTASSEFKRLWLARNREGGLAASSAAFDKLLGQYAERLRELKSTASLIHNNDTTDLGGNDDETGI